MTENEAIKAINDKYETLFALSTTSDFDMAMAESIKALEEIQQYRAIGTVEGYKRALEISKENFRVSMEYKAKVQEFEAIGTIEEFKDLKEKNTPKKIAYQIGKNGLKHEKCPTCGSFHVFGNYCTECGQAVDYD